MSFKNLPPRNWSWEIPGGDSVYSAEITPCGIHWYGDHKNPLFGGHFGIGLQSFEDFLAHGAAAEAHATHTVAAEIRSTRL